jgi:hypothetical protein
MVERAQQDSGSLITQSIDAVKSLLAFVGRASDPLPTFLELPDKRCILVLSNKKDVYYTVTPYGCSCPSATYRPGKTCKHQRRYFPEATTAGEGYTRPMTMVATLEDHERRLPNLPKSYQRMVRAAREKAQANPDSIEAGGKWPGGQNGPVDPDTIETRPSIIREMLIDCGHDTTLRDVAYWEKKQGQVV